MKKADVSAGFGHMIRQHRLKKGFTQADVAKMLGVSKSTVGKWETGVVHNFKLDTMYRLAQLIDLEPLSLFGIAHANSQQQKTIVSIMDFSEEEFEELCHFIRFIKSKRGVKL